MVLGLRLTAILIFALGASTSFAKKSGFLDQQKGVTLGYGLYKHWLTLDYYNAYDPVPALADSGTSIAGSDNISFRPTKMGYFQTSGKAEMELYVRYMFHPAKTWTASGLIEGSGSTDIRSYGVGLNAGLAFVTYDAFQTKLVLNGEWVTHRAKISFTDLASNSQLIKLSATSMLAGAGLQPELALVDQWVLSLFAGYQYGLAKYWNVTSENASFLGRAHDQGEVLGADGKKSKAQFGGFLLEAGLKLNFQ